MFHKSMLNCIKAVDENSILHHNEDDGGHKNLLIKSLKLNQTKLSNKLRKITKRTKFNNKKKSKKAKEFSSNGDNKFLLSYQTPKINYDINDIMNLTPIKENSNDSLSYDVYSDTDISFDEDFDDDIVFGAHKQSVTNIYDTSIDSISSTDSDYYTGNSESSQLNFNEIKKLNFTPNKTSSRKSLLNYTPTKLYKNLTLIFDYKCNICNLYLSKGQYIDCEYDEFNNKFILSNQNIFSSTFISNSSCNLNANNNHSHHHHQHEIEPDDILELLVLQQKQACEIGHQKICRITQF